MFDQKEAIIITFDQEDSITKGDKKISVEPAWKWLLK